MGRSFRWRWMPPFSSCALDARLTSACTPPWCSGPLGVDASDRSLDLLAVRLVLGEALARRIDERTEHHALAPLRTRAQQVVERMEAAHDVLRQLDAVDAHDELAVAHLLVEPAQRVGAPVGRSHGPDVVGIGGGGRDER